MTSIGSSSDSAALMATPLGPQPSGWVGSFAFRAAVSFGLIGYLVWQVDLDEVAMALSGLSWHFWILAWATYLVSQACAAMRWAGLARPVGFPGSRWKYLKLFYEGLFFSLCLPTSIGGDVIKAWRLGTNTRHRVLAGFTVLTDRITGLVALVLIGCGALAYQVMSLTAWQALGIALAVLVGAFLAIHIALSIAARLSVGLAWFEKLAFILVALSPYLSQPRLIWRAIGLSLVIQSMNAISVWLIGEAMNVDIMPIAYFVAVPAASLAALLPSISGFGVREAALAFFLSQYGLPQYQGITLGLLFAVVIILTGLVGGAAYLTERRSTASLRRTTAADGANPASTR
jgi:uncharacterized protein (TIRG00374 family)